MQNDEQTHKFATGFCTKLREPLIEKKSAFRDKIMI